MFIRMDELLDYIKINSKFEVPFCKSVGMSLIYVFMLIHIRTFEQFPKIK